MLKGVLLDIDGTLVKSNDAHASAWQEALKKFGHRIPFERIRLLIGMGGDFLLPTLLPQLDEAQKKEISRYRKTVFLYKYAPILKPTPSSRELVVALKKRNFKLIAATSASKEELAALLKAGKVDDLIKNSVTKTDVSHSKPASDIVSASLLKLHLFPEEAIMIGDTPYDISAAKKCGVRTIALRCGGFGDNTLKDAFAIYDDPFDLLKHFDEALHKL